MQFSVWSFEDKDVKSHPLILKGFKSCQILEAKIKHKRETERGLSVETCEKWKENALPFLKVRLDLGLEFPLELIKSVVESKELSCPFQVPTSDIHF